MTDPIWTAAETEFQRKRLLTRGDVQTLLKHRHGIALSDKAIEDAFTAWVRGGRVECAAKRGACTVTAIYKLKGFAGTFSTRRAA